MAEAKLRRAGASRVVSPYAIGGTKVAMAVLRPAVVDFIELATGTEHLDLQIEETLIQPGTLSSESRCTPADCGRISVSLSSPSSAAMGS